MSETEKNDVKIIPLEVEYYKLKSESGVFSENLIYPVS